MKKGDLVKYIGETYKIIFYGIVIDFDEIDVKVAWIDFLIPLWHSYKHLEVVS